MPEIDWAHKNCLTYENHCREIFYGSLIFSTEVVGLVLAAMLEGMTLPAKKGGE